MNSHSLENASITIPVRKMVECDFCGKKTDTVIRFTRIDRDYNLVCEECCETNGDIGKVLKIHDPHILKFAPYA